MMPSKPARAVPQAAPSVLGFAVGCLLLAGCSKASLEPVPPPPPPQADNLLRVKGQACTEPPDVAPFPVKVLIAIDQSASLQFTDPENRRFLALRRVFSSLESLPNAYFGFLGFASWARKQPFTKDMSKLQPFLDPNSGGGVATDYQGALASILQMLEQDMIDSGPAQRARTRYVVVFISDGMPEPRCRQGCEDDARTCNDGIDNDGDGLIDGGQPSMLAANASEDDGVDVCTEEQPQMSIEAQEEAGGDPDCNFTGSPPDRMGMTTEPGNACLRPDILYFVCNTDRPIRDGDYVDMAGRCPEYNQPRQILQRVEEIRTLERIYSVGELVMHTVFLTAPLEDLEALAGMVQLSFGYDPKQATDLLTEMARLGGGTFKDVNARDDDATFLDYDYNSLKTPYHATAFVATNQNAHNSAAGLRADSDGDGLADDDERESGTDAYSADTDQVDGYGDLFETRFRRSGFDPADGEVPAQKCDEPIDRDGDGLNDCEEARLKTDPLNPDTDGDRILDGVELRIGTQPNEADAERDPDFDGVINRSEVQGNTDPKSIDADRFVKERVRYIVNDVGERTIVNESTGQAESRRCYDFDISRLELTPTSQPTDPGRNRIYLHVLGQPLGLTGTQGLVRQACVEVKYSGPTSKMPFDGEVDLSLPKLTSLHENLAARIEKIRQCLPFEDFARPDVEDMIIECLPPRQRLDDYLFDREDVINLLRRYYDRELISTLPTEPSDFFIPLAEFDADTHCFRAWEISRLDSLLQTIEERCSQCSWVRAQIEESTAVDNADDDTMNEGDE